MPFTVAHVAAVLPLRGRWQLPLAPLVLGSMAPDVWLFLGMRDVRDLAHTATGVLLVDLPVVLVAGVAWHHVLRAPVADLLPALSARWSRRAAPSARDLRWAGRWLLSALAGTLTHVVWDLFTHDSGWAVQRIGPLQESWSGLSVATWLQYVCSVLGLVVIAAVVLRWWRTTPPGPPVAAGLLTTSGRRAVAATVAAAMAAGAAYRAAGPVSAVLGLRGNAVQVGPWRLRVLVTDLLLGAGVAFVVAVVLLAAAWHVRRALQHGRAGSGAPPRDPATAGRPSGAGTRHP